MLNVIDYIRSSILEELFYTVAIQPTNEMVDKAVEMLVARLTNEKTRRISGIDIAYENNRAQIIRSTSAERFSIALSISKEKST